MPHQIGFESEQSPLRVPRLVKSVRRVTWWRLAWVAMFTLHAPITVNAFAFIWRDNAAIPSWSSVVLLAASNLFFILEIAFACSLRLVSNRRAALTMLLIVLLLHVGVFERTAPALLPAQGLRMWLVLAAAATILATWLSLVRAMLVARIGDAHAALRHDLRRYARLSWARFVRRPLIARLVAVPLRAPPALRN